MTHVASTDGNADWLFHTITNQTSVTTPPISFVGPARVIVKAIASLATGTQGVVPDAHDAGDRERDVHALTG